MLYTHRNVSFRIAGGRRRRRNVRVTVSGERDAPAVRAAIVDVLAATYGVPADQVSLAGDARPKDSPPESPASPQWTRAEIRALNRAELIELIDDNADLAGIDTSGTVKAMETAVFTRLGI